MVLSVTLFNSVLSQLTIFFLISPNALMIDHWEIDGNQVSLDEEVGEGAFGKVYKGTLKELTTPSQRAFLKPSKKSVRSINGGETFLVAVKMLHGKYKLF